MMTTVIIITMITTKAIAPMMPPTSPVLNSPFGAGGPGEGYDGALVCTTVNISDACGQLK